MKPLILAIDDDQERYDHLRDLLQDRATLTIASCPACVAAELARAPAAVLLDYDLDLLPCPRCGADTGAERRPSGWVVRVNDHGKSPIHVPTLGGLGLPVIVTSAAGRAADPLVPDLRAYGLPHVARISCVETDPEIRWIGRLWAWGVL